MSSDSHCSLLHEARVLMRLRPFGKPTYTLSPFAATSLVVADLAQRGVVLRHDSHRWATMTLQDIPRKRRDRVGGVVSPI